MIKKRWILFFVLLVNLVIVSAQEQPTSDYGIEADKYGVCSNPYINFNFYGYFCSGEYTTTKDACCPIEAINPEDGIDLYNHPLYPSFPKNKVDCENNFFSYVSAAAAGCNAKGCCFDPYTGCYQEYKSVCSGIGGAEFKEGDCSGLNKCDAGCCCDFTNKLYYYNYPRGSCTFLGGTFHKDMSQVECNQECSTQCSDGVDNDGDGCIDLADVSCDGESSNDNEADDVCGNGECDCGESVANCQEDCTVISQCNDGEDNDIPPDGCKDYPEDIGCASTSDNDETDIGCNNNLKCDCGEDITACPNDCKIGECNDGVDNDNDGCVDFGQDLGCISNEDNDEEGGQCEPDTVEARCNIVTKAWDVISYNNYGIFTNCYWSGGVFGGDNSCFNDDNPQISFEGQGSVPSMYAPNCCGDDFLEFYSYMNVFRSDSSNLDSCDQPGGCTGNNYVDDACCLNFGYFECVYQGSCHTSEDIFNPGERVASVAKIDGSDPNSGYALCISTITHPYASWVDCDGTVSEVPMCSLCNQNSHLKSFYPTKAGEASVGEYNDLTTVECCQDDANEYYHECEQSDVPGVPKVAWACVSIDSACCNSMKRCVKNGKCYAGQPASLGFNGLPEYIYSGLNPGRNDDKAFCGDDVWIECDYINPVFGKSFCTKEVCGNRDGVLCGEADCGAGSTGEYIDKTTIGCCGDDAYEYYKCNVDNVCRCCNRASDTVDINGNCS